VSPAPDANVTDFDLASAFMWLKFGSRVYGLRRLHEL
jgi:hypothetical protein